MEFSEKSDDTFILAVFNESTIVLFQILSIISFFNVFACKICRV